MSRTEPRPAQEAGPLEQVERGPIAKTPPKRRRRPLLLYFMVALSLSLIAGTVLLSNDMRHLRALLKAADLDWLPDRPAVAKKIPPAPPEPVQPETPKILLRPGLLKIPEPGVASALRRTWQMTGADMCKALRTAGIDMSPWQAAAIGGDIFECSYEKIYRKKGERVESSLFVMVRGDSHGRITSMRAKLVDPPRQPGGNLDPALLSVFETMLTQSRWGDFDAPLQAIRTFHDIRKEGFGAAMSFTREFDNDRNFNFLLTLKATSAEQKQLNDLFRADNTFDLPQEPTLGELFPGLVRAGGADAHTQPTQMTPEDPSLTPPDAVPVPAAPRETVPSNGLPTIIRTPAFDPAARDARPTPEDRRNRIRFPQGESHR